MTEEELQKERRAGFEDHAKDEVPKLTNVKAVIAHEYYSYGWADAITYFQNQQIQKEQNVHSH